MEADDAALKALGEALLQHDEDAFVVLRVVRDAEGQVVDFDQVVANRAAERNAGQRLAGRRLLEVYPVEKGSMFDAYRALVLSGEALSTEMVATGEDPATRGRTYQVYARPVDADWLVCQYRDVTDLRHAQRTLEEQATQDPLTGLPNRRLLLAHAERALAALSRHEAVVALLFCDLDDFKDVNDRYGHPLGDEVLRQVALRLQEVVRPEDTVARFGGDEFVVLITSLSDPGEATAMAARIREHVHGDYRLSGRVLRVGMTVGVATTSRLVTVEQLLAEADAALYESKGRGRAR